YTVLGKIQEKVEAQRSAGVDAAQMRVIDRPQGAPPPDETDREMARTLLVGKGRKKKRRKQARFYEKGWFVVAGLLALFGALVFTLVLLFRPPPPEKLYEQAKALMESKEPGDHDTAAAGPIKQYLRHYADRPGEQTDQVRAWAAQVPVEECERLIAGKLKKIKSKQAYHAQDEAQEQAFAAVDDEWAGKLFSARKKWEALQKAYGDDAWGLTAGRSVDMLRAVDGQEAEWKKLLATMRDVGKEPDLPPPAREAFRAYRAEHFGSEFDDPKAADPEAAHKYYEAAKELAWKDGENRYWIALGARKAEEVKEP